MGFIHAKCARPGYHRRVLDNKGRPELPYRHVQYGESWVDKPKEVWDKIKWHCWTAIILPGPDGSRHIYDPDPCKWALTVDSNPPILNILCGLMALRQVEKTDDKPVNKTGSQKEECLTLSLERIQQWASRPGRPAPQRIRRSKA